MTDYDLKTKDWLSHPPPKIKKTSFFFGTTIWKDQRRALYPSVVAIRPAVMEILTLVCVIIIQNILHTECEHRVRIRSLRPTLNIRHRSFSGFFVFLLVARQKIHLIDWLQSSSTFSLGFLLRATTFLIKLVRYRVSPVCNYFLRSELLRFNQSTVLVLHSL